ncbi:hypothetical protein F383_27471 [Gossypium arboreum]|uniref:Uncharacterized protein n=1 Tax=Gossypium arboreum TaxID=29729 RepID=A0A0B0MER8_GOSAR|nr:hypothetical protein F383_38366 [Gossypium arboreum]KHG21872.1 hypothetical protein F383_27471 [Gossypium arboreum]
MCCRKDLARTGNLLISFLKGSSSDGCSFEWLSLPKNMCALWI